MSLISMKELLEDARCRKYAVGYFNVINMEMIRACITAAERNASPVIIGTSQGLLSLSDYRWLAPLLVRAAAEASVPVAVHLDHAYNFEVIMQATRHGFGSVMFDGSRLSVEENTKKSAQLARIVHAMGVGIECELGKVGGLEDEEHHVDELVYTDPALAASFVHESHADFLAVSIGTIHGTYRREPKLNFSLLEQLSELVSIPLVLHGGSGLSDTDFSTVIAKGISKINVYTDVIVAANKAVCADLTVSYTDKMRAAEQAMEASVSEKLMKFCSNGKA